MILTKFVDELLTPLVLKALLKDWLLKDSGMVFNQFDKGSSPDSSSLGRSSYFLLFHSKRKGA